MLIAAGDNPDRMGSESTGLTNYVERRTAEGKNRREAIRCLKRYVA
ncbi:hypothetical protein ACFCYB_40260 [Streptomyces sp. NPDC056309]